MSSFDEAGAGRYLTDPKQMVKGKTAAPSISDTAGTSRAATVAEFWTAGIAPQGVQIDTDFTADTYKDLIDITSGAGIIGNVLGPTAGGSETTTFRITRDGAAVEIAIPVDSGDRAFLGPLIRNDIFTAASRIGNVAHSVLSNSNTQFDLPTDLYVPSIMVMQAFNWGGLSYATSLKVEIKHSANVTGTASQERRCGLTYYDGFQ